MQKIKVYTTDYCPYCTRAKSLLKDQGLDFEEIRVDNDDQKRKWLTEFTGQRTVPQIIIGDKPIGGFRELSELVEKNQLASLLKDTQDPS